MPKIKVNAIFAMFSVANHFAKQVLKPLSADQSSGSVHWGARRGQNEVKRGGCRILWGKWEEMRWLPKYSF